jgi:hypothetical protein
LPVVIDKSLVDEPYWVEPWGHFDYFCLQNVDISNNLSGELYLQNASGLFIYNGLKECIYVYCGCNFTLINKYLPVEILCPVQFAHYMVSINHVVNDNVLCPVVRNYHYLPELTATQYLHRRYRLNGSI